MGPREEMRLNTPSFTAWLFFSVKEQVLSKRSGSGCVLVTKTKGNKCLGTH